MAQRSSPISDAKAAIKMLLEQRRKDLSARSSAAGDPTDAQPHHESSAGSKILERARRRLRRDR